MKTEGAPQNQDSLMIVENLNKNLTVLYYYIKGDSQESSKQKPLFNQSSPKHLSWTDLLNLRTQHTLSDNPVNPAHSMQMCTPQ